MNNTPKRRTVLKTIAGTGLTAVGAASVLTSISEADPTGDIPSHYLDQYRQTGSNWGLDWTYLAGIGWVETHHGQYEAGCDESGAGARGPMQFMPATWDAYGVDGNGDGVKNICDYQDAIPAAANYLTASGAPGNWNEALYAYNPSWDYVNHVKDTAGDYRARYGDGGGGGGDGFDDGDRVTPTTALNTRHRPGTESEILATISPGTVGEIMNGPVNEDGYTWWGVHWLADDIWGWSAGQYLTLEGGGGGGTDFTWPISGYITSPYGARPGHYAVDIGNNGIIGTPIYAARDGVVDIRSYEAGGCGNYLKLGHENGYQTMYCHLHGFAVSQGQRVSRGQKIGGMGNTGNSTGPHLHFTIEQHQTHLSIPGSDGQNVTAGEAIPKDYGGI